MPFSQKCFISDISRKDPGFLPQVFLWRYLLLDCCYLERLAKNDENIFGTYPVCSLNASFLHAFTLH